MHLPSVTVYGNLGVSGVCWAPEMAVLPSRCLLTLGKEIVTWPGAGGRGRLWETREAFPTAKSCDSKGDLMRDSRGGSSEAAVRDSTPSCNAPLGSEIKELSLPGILPASAVPSAVTVLELMLHPCIH